MKIIFTITAELFSWNYYNTKDFFIKNAEKLLTKQKIYAKIEIVKVIFTIFENDFQNYSIF